LSIYCTPFVSPYQSAIYPNLILFHGITSPGSPISSAALARQPLPCCAPAPCPTPSPSPKSDAAKEAAAAAAHSPAPGANPQQDEIAARLAKEKASAVAKEWQEAYDAAPALVAQAEEDAAKAIKARDAAAQAIAAAAALHPSTQEASSAGGPTPSMGGPADLQAAMLLQEAAALLNLHAQAVAVNIRSLVHIVLDVDSGNFNRWRDQFLLSLGKFSLQDHVYLDAPVPSQDWDRMDCVVKS